MNTEQRRRALENQIAQATAALAEIDRFGVDTFPAGTVLRFKLRLSPSQPKRYTYTAMKLHTLWYLTTTMGSRLENRRSTRFTWDEMTALWARGDVKQEKIKVVSEWSFAYPELQPTDLSGDDV